MSWECAKFLAIGFWCYVSLMLNQTFLVLQLLETCVKNCGKRFHVQVANKDFLHDIVKIIGPKNNPSEQVQEKVLSLIQVSRHMCIF
jgi:hypothetical protein